MIDTYDLDQAIADCEGARGNPVEEYRWAQRLKAIAHRIAAQTSNPRVLGLVAEAAEACDAVHPEMRVMTPSNVFGAGWRL